MAVKFAFFIFLFFFKFCLKDPVLTVIKTTKKNQRDNIVVVVVGSYYFLFISLFLILFVAFLNTNFIYFLYYSCIKTSIYIQFQQFCSSEVPIVIITIIKTIHIARTQCTGIDIISKYAHYTQRQPIIPMVTAEDQKRRSHNYITL